MASLVFNYLASERRVNISDLEDLNNHLKYRVGKYLVDVAVIAGTTMQVYLVTDNESPPYTLLTVVGGKAQRVPEYSIQEGST
jgi:chemotaxis protein CheY-P-specific phosphatase CheC